MSNIRDMSWQLLPRQSACALSSKSHEMLLKVLVDVFLGELYTKTIVLRILVHKRRTPLLGQTKKYIVLICKLLPPVNSIFKLNISPACIKTLENTTAFRANTYRSARVIERDWNKRKDKESKEYRGRVPFRCLNRRVICTVVYSGLKIDSLACFLYSYRTIMVARTIICSLLFERRLCCYLHQSELKKPAVTYDVMPVIVCVSTCR